MKYLIYIILAIAMLEANAQSDSVKVNYYSDTCIQSNVGEYDRILRHIIPSKEEVKILYKIDVLQLAFKNPNFAVEKKMKENSSLEFYFLGDVTKPITGYIDGGYSYNSNIYTLYFKADYKYYHNYDRRLRKGKNTNGFSGNYFVCGLTVKPVIYNTDDYKVGMNGMLYPTYGNNFYQHPHNGSNYTAFYQGRTSDYITPSLIYLNVGYGLQRRLGNIGYVSAETKIGLGTSINFNHVYIPWELSIRAGFALSSLRFKK